MKHKGSISQVNLRRDRIAIPDVCRRARHLAEYPTTTIRICEIAADLPVNRFYISDDAALMYIYNRAIRGKQKKFVNPYKQKLFDALWEVVSSMMEQDKYKQQGITTTTIQALQRPAPCIGLTPYVIYILYLKHRKHHHERK